MVFSRRPALLRVSPASWHATDLLPGFLSVQAVAAPVVVGSWDTASIVIHYNPSIGLPSWDEQYLTSTFSTMTLNLP